MANLNDLMEYAELFGSQAVITFQTRCVAVRNRHATCRACIEACPADAFTIENNELKLNNRACVACGACIAVCPTEALVSVQPLEEQLKADVAEATLASNGVALIACARIDARKEADPKKYAVVPCMARIDEALLLDLAAHGVEDIRLVDGTCRTCKYRATSSFTDDTIASAQTLLEMVGNTTLITRTSEFPEWARHEHTSKAYGEARREFLTSTGDYAKDVAKSAAEKMINDKLKQLKLAKEEQTLRDKLKVRPGAGKMPTIAADRNMEVLDALSRIGEPCEPEVFTRLFGEIHVDTETCSGCGMCIMFCPTDALQWAFEEQAPSPSATSHMVSQRAKEENQSTKAQVEFHVANCTQCNLCADACITKSIEISPVVDAYELFDFEPRIIEINRPKKNKKLFGGH